VWVTRCIACVERINLHSRIELSFEKTRGWSKRFSFESIRLNVLLNSNIVMVKCKISNKLNAIRKAPYWLLECRWILASHDRRANAKDGGQSPPIAGFFPCHFNSIWSGYICIMPYATWPTDNDSRNEMDCLSHHVHDATEIHTNNTRVTTENHDGILSLRLRSHTIIAFKWCRRNNMMDALVISAVPCTHVLSSRLDIIEKHATVMSRDFMMEMIEQNLPPLWSCPEMKATTLVQDWINAKTDRKYMNTNISGQIEICHRLPSSWFHRSVEGLHDWRQHGIWQNINTISFNRSAWSNSSWSHCNCNALIAPLYGTKWRFSSDTP
jgi:hypothetical protein